MPNCCVPGCTNYSSKTTDISYHKIPTDPTLKKAWIARIRRDNLPPAKYCYVCSVHFEPECFEVNFMEQLLGQKSKRKLKAGSIPSIFDFSPSSAPGKRPGRSSSENRAKRKRNTEVCYLQLLAQVVS